MSKEEALKTATNFLRTIYKSDIDAVATIITAEANKDYKVIVDALDGVLEFVEGLKVTLNN